MDDPEHRRRADNRLLAVASAESREEVRYSTEHDDGIGDITDGN